MRDGLRAMNMRVKTGVADYIVSVFMNDEEGMYSIDMSLTRFWQFFTKVVMLYWIITTSTASLPYSTISILFDLLTNCQAIKILSPNYN